MKTAIGISTIILVLAVLLIGLIRFGPHEPQNDREPRVAVGVEFPQLPADGLPNCFQLCDEVYSGGQPKGFKGFKQLTQMGVKTIISVDGARPDVEMAKQFGLKYVHLPHGYNGIDQSHAMKLAKAVVTVEKPIYIHCHHGKHRSPAAASIACIGVGDISVEQGQQFLRIAGTSQHYKGLYNSVANATTFGRTN